MIPDKCEEPGQGLPGPHVQAGIPELIDLVIAHFAVFLVIFQLGKGLNRHAFPPGLLRSPVCDKDGKILRAGLLVPVNEFSYRVSCTVIIGFEV